METKEKEVCEVCKELIKRIELTQTTYEAIDLETALYRHQLTLHKQEAAS